MSNYLFAYGMFRDAARNLLGKPKHIGRKSVLGTMWRVDPFYPGVVLDNKNVIWGDLYEIDTKVLPELDEFEGDYDEDELRLMRIKFISKVAN